MTTSTSTSSTPTPRLSRRARWLDIGERAAWTLLQAGVGVAVVDALDIPEGWAAVIALSLAVLKGELASKFGNGSAATLPATSSAAPPAPPSSTSNVDDASKEIA